MTQLIDSCEKKKILSNAIKVLILGPASVGKSTLFNSFIGLDRALVSQILVRHATIYPVKVPIGDYRVEFIDCAGIRKTDDSTENLGIEKTMEIIDEASLILFVIDGSVPYPTDFDPRAMDKIKGKDILILENKSDLPKVVSREKYPDHIECVEICAHQRKDTKKIISLIEEHLRQMFFIATRPKT